MKKIKVTEAQRKAMGVIDDRVKIMALDELSETLNRGAALIEKHGRENLNNKLKSEEDFLAAGLFFDYELISNNISDEDDEDVTA
jgi:hypothetical protein